MASFNFYLSRHQNLYLQINLKKRLITIFLLVFFLVIPCGGFMPAYAAIPKIVAGDNHTIAIKADGTLWAWGYNPYGELGNGSNDGSAHPVPTRVGIDNRWTAVAIGSWHTIAQKADATLWAWGGNSSGQLSLSADNITYNMDSNAHPNPIQIRMDANWIAVAAQLNRTFAQKTDGTLWGWGDNHYGALGTGSIVNSATPIPAQIGTDANWAGVSAGENHTFAQKTDGTLWAWGYNSYGQLGIGSADTSAHPIPVQTVTDATWLSVAAGGVHTIALKTDGTLWAWGGNSYCQLGISSTDTNAHPSPVQIGTDANWLSVAAGGVHTIALKTDGTLWAWGDNRYGQLGIGSAETNTQPSPVQIGTDTDWATIAVGGFNSFALKTDGTLWAWGRNNYGQLGDGTTLDQIAPVKIMELNHNDLIVKKAGTGSGSVTGSGTYDYGTTQIITASADTGSTFTGWSGNCTGATSQIDVLVDGDKICTATFTLNQYDLTVNNAGNGSGKITGAGTYDYGSTQMLIATADTGSTFTGWSGSCSGTERVVGVLIGGNVNCTATFTLKQFILTVDKKGTGSGLVTGSGTYDYGTTQIVNATANTGSTFTGWNGNCSGTISPINILIDGYKSCSAIFTIDQHSLTVNKTGTGSGSVTGSGTYDYGTTQVVNAMADTGSTFTGWGGNCSGAKNEIDILVDGDKTCIATFTLDQYALAVNITGSGGGTVTSAPLAIDCRVGCSGLFDYATEITLTAVPDKDSTFIGWSGTACTGTENCIVTMDAKKEISAVFEENFPWPMFLPAITKGIQ